MKKCKIKLNQLMDLGDVIILPGVYDGHQNGINDWPDIEYDGELYDFIPDEIDIEFIDE